MPKKFDIMYVAYKGDQDPYVGLLKGDGWTARLSQKKMYRKPIPAGSTAAQIIQSIYPDMPLGLEQPAYWILTREVRSAGPAGGAGASSQPAGASVASGMEMNIEENDPSVAALSAQIGSMKMGTENVVIRMRQEGQGAVAQRLEAVADELSQDDIAGAVEQTLEEELLQKMGGLGLQGGRRRHQATRRSRRGKKRSHRRGHTRRHIRKH